MKFSISLRYIFTELIPSYFIGILAFIGLLLIFQALRLTELLVMRTTDFLTLTKLTLFLTISLLPAILPMSVLFAVIFTYGKLASDSEITAFRSLGWNTKKLAIPAITLGTAIAVICFQVSFFLGPWGNRNFELLIAKLTSTKVTQNLRAGSFSEGFYDLVVFAEEINDDTGELKNIFIFDERNPTDPISIVSRSGQIIEPQDRFVDPTTLRLLDGEVYLKSEGRNSQIQFEGYDIYLSNMLGQAYRHKSPQSLDWNDIVRSLDSPPKFMNATTVQIELHKRLTLSLACLAFALLGVGIASTGSKRFNKSNGFLLSVGIVAAYWILYVTAEGIAKKNLIAPAIALWLIALIFLSVGIYFFRKIEN